MFSLLFHLTLTLISRPLGAYTASAPDGGLLDSCNTSTIIFTAVNGPVTLEDPYYTTTPVLSGECLTKGGEYTNSSLDLNACLENINDSLAVRILVFEKCIWANQISLLSGRKSNYLPSINPAPYADTAESVAISYTVVHLAICSFRSSAVSVLKQKVTSTIYLMYASILVSL
jgi:hypothetical protein